MEHMKLTMRTAHFPIFIRLLLRFLGLFCLLLALAYGFILIPGVQYHVQKKVLNSLNRYGHISIRTLRMDWRFYLRIYQIQWSDPEAGRQITCDTLGVQLAPLRLIRREIPVSRIDVRGLSGNGGSLDSFKGETRKTVPETNRPSHWTWRHCRFQAADVSLSVQSDSTLFSLTGLRGWIYLRRGMTGEGALHIDAFDLQHHLKPLSLGPIFAGISLQNNPEDSLNFQSKFFGVNLRKLDDGHYYGIWKGTDYQLVLSWLGLRFPVQRITGQGDLGVSFSPFYLKTQSRLFLDSESALIPDSLQFSGTVFPDRIESVQLGVPWLEGKVDVTGSVGFDSSALSTLSLSVSRLSLDRLWWEIQNNSSPFRGYFSGHLTGSGPGLSFQDWSGQGTGTLSRLVYQTQPVSDLDAQLFFSPDSVGFSAHQLITEISGQFLRQRSGPKGELRFRNLRTRLLAPWMQVSGMQGRIHGNASLSGTWAAPEGRMHIWSEQLTYQFLTVDSFNIEGGYKQSQWIIDQARMFAHSDSELNSSGPFSGNLQVSADCAGPLNQLRGQIRAQGHVLRWNRFHADSLELNVSLLNQMVTTESMLQIDSLNMRTEGFFRLDSLQGELHGTMMSTGDTIAGRWITLIDTLYGFRFQTEKRLAMSVLSPFYPQIPKGFLFFQGIYQPFKNTPSGELVIEMSHLKLISDETSVSGYINLNNQTARFQTKLINGSDSLRMNGALSGVSSRSEPPTIQARIDGRLNSLTLYSQIFQNITLGGRAETELRVTGPLQTPLVFGNCRIFDGSLALRTGSQVVESFGLTLRFLGDSLQTEASGRFATRPFSLKGGFRLFRPEHKLRLTWQSDSTYLNYYGRFTKTGWEGTFRARDFDIQLFQPFLPTLQKLQGRLNAAYTTFPSDSTEQQSYIRLDDVSLQESHIPIQASEVRLALDINPQRLTLNQFTGKLNGGGFRGTGSLNHNRFRVTEGGMHIDAWDLSVNKEKTVQVRLDSLNLDFTTLSGQHELSGFVILDESRFTQSIRLTDLLATMDQVRRPWKKNSEFQKKTALNLHIHNSHPFWVDNNLAKLNMNGNFSLYGTLASPYILGQISVQKGYVLYLDRKFQVKEGRLDFVDPESPYPEVTFQAEKEMKSYETFSGNVYQITFGLTGPANRVKPSWTSEPPLSEPDVLSLLTLGATRRELTRDQEGSGNRLTNVLQDRLTLLSSQKVSSYATKTLGNLFGLENVAVEGNLFQFGKSWGPQLLASKKLSDRLSVTYKTAVGQSNTQEVRLDYKLTNRFSLEGQTDQKGKSGIDILYKLKY
jgi:hypothetical protein